MAGVPTPELYRGEVENLEYRCADFCEWWVTRPCNIALQSVALNPVGQNWKNAKPLIAVGGRRSGGPADCASSPLTSRFNLVISYLKPYDGEPDGTVPPPMHLEIRAGDEGAVSRVTRVIWTPQGWDDFADVVQYSGLLVSRWEVWGWVELAPGNPPFPLPYNAKFSAMIDRLGGGQPFPFINPLANVIADNS